MANVVKRIKTQQNISMPNCLAWRQILSMASNVKASHLLGLGSLVPKYGRDTETV